MKCNEAEKYLLLKDSGELTARRGLALEAHLDSCTSCREFAGLLESSIAAIDLVEEPSVRCVQNVLRTARVNAPTAKRHFALGYKPALASFASVVLLVGVLVGNMGSNKIGMELIVTNTQLLEPEDQVVSVMYDGLSEDDLAFNFLMTYEDNSEG